MYGHITYLDDFKCSAYGEGISLIYRVQVIKPGTRLEWYGHIGCRTFARVLRT